MTIDERLEMLAERHQALTETVEVIAGMQRKNEQSIEAVAATVQELAVSMHHSVEGMQSAVQAMAKSMARNMGILIKYA